MSSKYLKTFPAINSSLVEPLLPRAQNQPARKAYMGRIKAVMSIRGQYHYPQDIELTVQKSHSALRLNGGATFTVELNGSERLVIVQEVERSYLGKLDVNEVVGKIRQAVRAEHSLQVYAIVLVKTGSIPKTTSGKIRRHACRSEFLTNGLNLVGDWSQNPLGKAKFRCLQTDVESLWEKVPKKPHPHQWRGVA